MSKFSITEESVIKECIVTSNGAYAWVEFKPTEEIGNNVNNLIFIDAGHFLSKNITPPGLEEGIGLKNAVVTTVTTDMDGYDILEKGIIETDGDVPSNLVMVELPSFDTYVDMVRWLTNQPKALTSTPDKEPGKLKRVPWTKPHRDGKKEEEEHMQRIMEAIKNVK